MVPKKELILKCREILYKKELEEQDKEFLKSLLKNHPTYNLKVGVGIKDFFIKKTLYGTMGFNIIRIDNSTTDFSFMECISPKNNIRKIKCACRTAIRPAIIKTKTDNNKIIHHENISFDKIVEEWLVRHKILNLELNKHRDNNQEIYFISQETNSSFIAFHNDCATLIEITPEEHKLKHRSKYENKTNLIQ